MQKTAGSIPARPTIHLPFPYPARCASVSPMKQYEVRYLLLGVPLSKVVRAVDEFQAREAVKAKLTTRSYEILGATLVRDLKAVS